MSENQAQKDPKKRSAPAADEKSTDPVDKQWSAMLTAQEPIVETLGADMIANPEHVSIMVPICEPGSLMLFKMAVAAGIKWKKQYDPIRVGKGCEDSMMFTMLLHKKDMDIMNGLASQIGVKLTKLTTSTVFDINSNQCPISPVIAERTYVFSSGKRAVGSTTSNKQLSRSYKYELKQAKSLIVSDGKISLKGRPHGLLSESP